MTYESWTTQEVQEYERIRVTHPTLIKAYKFAEIPVSEPAKRAELLARKLGLTATDQQLIADITQKEGRPAGLQKLEEIFIVDFS